MHRATARFWECYGALSAQVREVADESYELLKKDPRHPSLRFKKVGKLWSARVGAAHRALALQDGHDFIWVWIGAHDEYERLIR